MTEADVRQSLHLASLEGRKLLIFDDMLRRIEDHPYEYALSVADMHVKYGVEVSIICHRELEDSAPFAALGVRLLPMIDFPPPLKIGGIRGELAEMARRNWMLFWLVRKHLRENHYDLVFVPNAVLANVFVWCLLKWTRQSASAKHLVLLIRYHFGMYTGATYIGLKKLIWKVALKCQRRAIVLGRASVVADSSRLASDYAEISGVKARVVPSPRTMPAPASEPPFKSTDRITFGALGSARYDKGSDLFQGAIKLLAKGRRDAGMKFVLQWHRPMQLPSGSICEIDAELSSKENVTYVREPLNSSDYDDLFRSIDCMVLPYRRELYRSSISGVCVEAACAGVPVICCDGTWLADFIADQGAGIVVPEGDVSALAQAIETIANGIDRYSQEARTISLRAREQNSPRRFMETLWQDLGTS